MNHAANEIVRQAQRIAELESLLAEIQDIFTGYAQSHAAKGTDEGRRKAETNQVWADKILVMLTKG